MVWCVLREGWLTGWEMISDKKTIRITWLTHDHGWIFMIWIICWDIILHQLSISRISSNYLWHNLIVPFKRPGFLLYCWHKDDQLSNCYPGKTFRHVIVFISLWFYCDMRDTVSGDYNISYIINGGRRTIQARVAENI